MGSKQQLYFYWVILMEISVMNLDICGKRTVKVKDRRTNTGTKSETSLAGNNR